MTERLSTAALGSLPPEVARPTYDRTGIKVGIAHIGVGGFHRSHQAMYLDRLLEQGAARDWGSAASACWTRTRTCGTH